MPATNDPVQRGLDAVEVQPSWGRHVVGIDGLRGLAAIGVLLIHVRELATPDVDLDKATSLLLVLGNQGLTLFFGISGFLLYRQFAVSLLTPSRLPALRRYAMNRALRIYPVYVVVLLLASLVLGTANRAPLTLDSSARADRVGFMTDPGLLGINATMLQTLFPWSMQTGLGVAWSLTVELVFYIVMPALAVGVWHITKRRSLLVASAPAIVLLITGIATRLLSRPLYSGLEGAEAQVALWGDTWAAVLARSFLYNADLFAFGMLAAVLLEYLRHDGRSMLPIQYVRPAAAAVIVLAAAGGYLGGFASPTLWALSCGALLFFVAFPNRRRQAPLVARALECAPLRYAGLVSYSVYLLHVSVIWVFVRNGWTVPGDGPIAFWANAGIVVVVTLLAASVTYFGVERPALKLKVRRRTPAAADAA